MNLHTASEVISLAKMLEADSARFYQDLAQESTGSQELFLSFTKENTRNSAQIESAYYGVISDAIEGGYAFDIDPDQYKFDTIHETYSKDLAKAVELEEKIVRFYSDAAAQSKSLLADVPRLFTIIARKRGNRISQLKLLIDAKR